MKNELQLSNESQEFIENLRLYLFSSGRNPDEIESIVDELTSHLYEAETNGKSIEKIIGNSPKEYMKMISNEMAIDYRTWIQYICLIIFGSFSFTILPDLLEGSLSYSVLEIAGHLVIGLFFIIMVLIGFHHLSTGSRSIKKQALVLGSIAFLPIALFIGLIFLNNVVETPVIQFGYTGSLLIGGLTALFIIGFSFWAKTWALIIILALLTLPDYFLRLTPWSAEVQLITSTLIMFGGVAIYFWIVFQLEKTSKA